MKTIVYAILITAAAFLIFWLKVFPFTEKKTKDPERTAHAIVKARRVQSGNPHRSGRSHMGYTYLVAFQLDDGTELELYAYEIEYGSLREGMTGMLTWKGRYFVSFRELTANN